MKDYYKTLGVEKTASKDDLKKAFRKLAHENHPDKNKDNPAATQKFKEASEAYSVLSDDTKRVQYDRFGSAGPGFNPGAGQGGFQDGFNGGTGFGGFDFSQFTHGQGFSQNGQAFDFDLGDIFGEFFGGGRRARKGRNITIDLQVTFKESIFGLEREISIGGREKLTITIPPGMESGQGLRVAGKGEKGEGGPGDLIVRVWVEESRIFRKEAFNLIMELPVKLTTALLGGIMEVETLDGKIELKIPQGTTHGEILRVKHRGVPDERGRRGDLLIVTRVNMPKKLSREAERLVEELKREGI
jgi:DnaJ-class molecular chaperone